MRRAWGKLRSAPHVDRDVDTLLPPQQEADFVRVVTPL